MTSFITYFAERRPSGDGFMLSGLAFIPATAVASVADIEEGGRITGCRIVMADGTERIAPGQTAERIVRCAGQFVPAAPGWRVLLVDSEVMECPLDGEAIAGMPLAALIEEAGMLLVPVVGWMLAPIVAGNWEAVPVPAGTNVPGAFDFLLLPPPSPTGSLLNGLIAPIDMPIAEDEAHIVAWVRDHLGVVNGDRSPEPPGPRRSRFKPRLVHGNASVAPPNGHDGSAA